MFATTGYERIALLALLLVRSPTTPYTALLRSVHTTNAEALPSFLHSPCRHATLFFASVCRPPVFRRKGARETCAATCLPTPYSQGTQAERHTSSTAPSEQNPPDKQPIPLFFERTTAAVPCLLDVDIVKLLLFIDVKGSGRTYVGAYVGRVVDGIGGGRSCGKNVRTG